MHIATQTVEQAKVIDVGWCNERGLFQGGVSGVITWTRERDGKEVASVGHAFVDDGPTDALVLFYTITANRGDEGPREVSYLIRIEYTECNFGGERPWFRCPVCDGRVAKLYKKPEHDQYACRDCGGLLYKLQTYRKPLLEAFDRLDEAGARVEQGELTPEALKEVYDAKQGVSAAFNDYLKDLDEKYGGFGRPAGRHRMNALPPFEEWADDLFH